MEPFAGLCFSSSSKPDAAWEELIGRFGTGLKARVGSVLRRCGVRPRNDHVEEIVQEVYCRLLAGGSRRLRRCRATNESQVGAYLGRVAERVALDQLRAARAQKRGGPSAAVAAAEAEGGQGEWRGGRGQRGERAVDPGANPEELVLSRERLRLFLERCGALAGRRDYRRNARILALAVAGMNSGEIARAVGGALTARSIDGLLLRVRRYAAAHVLDAGLDAGLPAPPAAPRRAHRTGPRAAGPRAAKPRG
jgi:DNA-directed RNA polymerase specialized sigma24 family protein